MGRRQLLAAVLLSASVGLLGGAAAAWGIYHRLGPIVHEVTVAPGSSAGGPASNPAAAPSILADAAPALVEVVTRPLTAADLLQESSGIANGFLVTSDGLVITTAHAVAGATQLRVALPDGRSAPATLAGSDPVHGLVALRAIGLSGLPTLAFASAEARPGDGAIAVGSPPLGGPSVTDGTVQATGRTLTVQQGATSSIVHDALSVDAAPDPEVDGGPLLDTSGHVIGVVVATSPPGSSGLEALSGQAARALVDAIGAGGAGSRDTLGLRTVFLDPATAAAVGAPSGSLITELTPGGPAAGAGLLPGDVVTAIDGIPVDRDHGLDAAAVGAVAGQRLTLSVTHQGRAATVVLVAA